LFPFSPPSHSWKQKPKKSEVKMKNKEKGLTLSLLFFRKRSFLNDFSTEEVSSPLSLSPAFKKVEKRKTAKGKRMCGWNKGEVVEVLEDAA
jgi:hypothetical protein